MEPVHVRADGMYPKGESGGLGVTRGVHGGKTGQAFFMFCCQTQSTWVTFSSMFMRFIRSSNRTLLDSFGFL